MMTNATTVENNNTIDDQIILNKEKCNQTTNTDKETQNCIVNILQVQNNHCSNNSSNSTTTDCETITAIEPNRKNNTKDNQVADKNTVLKYVYKKGDKADLPTKDKGHFKNSLRRKRSTREIFINKSPLPSKFQKPVIVNYETLHGPRDVGTFAPLRNTGNTILGANLADFNVKTVHVNTDIKNKENVVPNLNKDSTEVENLNGASNEKGGYKYNDDIRKSSRDREESGENRDYTNKKSQLENENSGEREDYGNRKQINKEQDSAEREDYKKRKSANDRDDSGESEDYKKIKSTNDRYDSGEREDYKKIKSNNDKDDSSERADYRSKKSSRENNDSTEHNDYKNRPSSLQEESSGERGAYKNSDSSHERGESGERGVYKNSESSHGRGYSGERGDYTDKRNGPRGTYNSDESTENNPKTNSKYSSRPDNSKESSESDENRKSDPNSAESKESAETDNGKKTHDGVQEIRNTGYNKEDISYKTPHSDDSKNKIEPNPRKNLEILDESGDESNEKRRKLHQNYKTDTTDDNNKSLPIPIQDVDLNNFSYERIHVNNNGKVEPQEGNLELVDPKTAVEILPLTTAVPDPEIKNHETLNFKDKTLETSEIENNDNKLIHIDDGEVKPVVEINPESSEENIKSNVSDEVESLESILGVKEPENFDDKGNNQKDNIVKQKEVQNGDVKQEFERIPLNYNHAKKDENKDSQSETPKEDTGVTTVDGTLDAFAPEDVKYDEHLNIKFDDLAIKLPEIKLPDDILAYTRESSPYSDDDDKKQNQPDVPSYKPSYYYNHDDRAKLRESKDKKDDEETDEDDDRAPDTGYYRYYDDSEKKEDYKKKDAEEAEAESDEEEDLYEKFVRERFGKRDTFEKRSEKLAAAAPQSPELYKTLKNILKKTADIDQQAKKSGDPNAGYMWTLEYGEKVV